MKKIIPILFALGLSIAGYYVLHDKFPINFIERATSPPQEMLSPNTLTSIPFNSTSESNNTPKTASSTISSIKVANWNMQIFGDSKSSNKTLMDFYASKITNYDIFFVQEIRDADGSSFRDLCSMLTNYDCNVSSRAGRSSSKEQYGIIYKKGIKLQSITDYNPDSQDRWERPPVSATFDVNGYDFTAYDIHTKPDDVPNEIKNLEGLVKDEGNVAVLGDMNADGSYYSHARANDFSNWTWVINDNEDTTVASSRNAYDRIIVNSNMNNEVVSYGIDSNNITSDKSDHYIIWVEIKTKE